MAPAEVRARVAQLRSDVEAAKRDHTQANATQAGVDLIVGFLEDINKEEPAEDLAQMKQGDAGQQPPGGAAGDNSPNQPTDTDKEAPASSAQPQTQPDTTGVPGEQKPATDITAAPGEAIPGNAAAAS